MVVFAAEQSLKDLSLLETPKEKLVRPEVPPWNKGLLRTDLGGQVTSSMDPYTALSIAIVPAGQVMSNVLPSNASATIEPSMKYKM